MNLEGSLSAFGLPDVFSLLQMTSKSGALRVRKPTAARPDRCGVVRFADGSVTSATPDEHRQSLVRRLVGAGLVDDDTLRDAVERAQGDEVGLTRALLDSGRVDEEQVREAARAQVVDGVFELLQWDEGDFEFVLDERDPDDVGIQLRVEEIVQQAREREEAWAEVLEVVPSSSAVLSIPVRPDGEPLLSHDEWAVLAMVDGRRPVYEIVELSGMGQFAVMSVAADLVRRGLLAVRDEDTPDPLGVVQRRLALLAPCEGGAPAPSASASAAQQPVQIRPDLAGSLGQSVIGIGQPAGHAEPSGDYPRVPDSPAALVDGPSYGGRASTAAQGDGRDADLRQSSVATLTQPVAATAAAPKAQHIIERDPSVNRSMLLRLIAGVRGL
ncbi:MAG: DUF4388 domain-containing protein [Candidatus Nanopelagicales bacterium]